MPDKYIHKSSCKCPFAVIELHTQFRPCLACREDCTEGECEPGDLPVEVFYMPNLNKVYMFFATEEEGSVAYWFRMTNPPTNLEIF